MSTNGKGGVLKTTVASHVALSRPAADVVVVDAGGQAVADPVGDLRKQLSRGRPTAMDALERALARALRSAT